MARLITTVFDNKLGTNHNSNAYMYSGAGQRIRQVDGGCSYLTNRYDIEGELIFANRYEFRGITRRNQEQFSSAYHASGNLNCRTNEDVVLKLTRDSENQSSTMAVTGTLTVTGKTTSIATKMTVNSTSLPATSPLADGSFALRGASFTCGLNTLNAVARDALGTKATNILSITSSSNASFA